MRKIVVLSFVFKWLLVSPSPGTAIADADASFMEMVTKNSTPVRRAPNRNTAVVAKIHPKTKIKVCRHSRMSDCPEGWYQRADWGFICGRHLRPFKETETELSREDAPDIRVGMEAAIVVQRKTPVYRKSKKNGRLIRIDEILSGSILSGTPNVVVENLSYFVTRRGYHVPMENVEILPPPIETLAISVAHVAPPPTAVVKGKPTDIYESPSETAPRSGQIDSWHVLTRAPLVKEGTFYRLPDGGYVKQDSISPVRVAPPPKKLESEERWIAVDLDAQLLHAYKGRTLIRLIPCSTGIKGNTGRGRFFIQRKLRQQTMRLRMGRVRVEDVQWVMYYDQDDAIAIHSAYWHREFGEPRSHGCVNVPTQDAKWLYEWTLPRVGETDSITIPLPRDSGTKVVVF